LTAIERDLPWVADLRDLWAGVPQGAGRTRLRRLPDAVAERILFARASALVTVSEGLAEQLRTSYPGLPVHAIPTGFDPDLIAPEDVRPSSDFRLVYAGRVKGRMDAMRFLRPLATSISAGRIDASRTRVDMLTMGTLREQDRDFIRREGIGDVVIEEGYLPRDEIIRRERQAHVLLQFRWDDPTETGILTGKLFEYLAARRPILSTGMYRDEVSTVLETTGAGVASTSDAETERFLMEAFRSFDETGRVPYGGRPEGLDRLDARRSAKRLAEVLDAVSR
jgi:glycosyltransferase involved in cell wall biosynthesis